VPPVRLRGEGLEPVTGLFRGVAARERSGAHARLLALLALDALGIALDACGSRPVLHLLRVVRVGKGTERDDKPFVVQQRLGAASLGDLGIRALFVLALAFSFFRSARPLLSLGLRRLARRFLRSPRRFALLRAAGDCSGRENPGLERPPVGAGICTVSAWGTGRGCWSRMTGRTTTMSTTKRIAPTSRRRARRLSRLASSANGKDPK